MTNRKQPQLKLAPRAVQEATEYAIHQIRDAIVAGKVRPGDRLVEMDLAAQLQVSRHPIREALRELGRQGLVSMRPNRGAVVAELNPNDILEVYEIRAALGGLALRHLLLGARPLPTRDLARLEQLARKTAAYAKSGNQPLMVQHDLEFQAMIVAASGLARAVDYFRSLGAEIQRFINVVEIDYPDKAETAQREVVGLFEAIRDHDHARADRIWRDKFVVAARRLAARLPGGEHECLDRRWLLTDPGTEARPPAHPATARTRRLAEG